MGGYANRPIIETIEVSGGSDIRREGHQEYVVLGGDGSWQWMVCDEGEGDVHIVIEREVDDPCEWDRTCIGSIEEARGIAAALNRICDEIEGGDRG